MAPHRIYGDDDWIGALWILHISLMLYVALHDYPFFVFSVFVTQLVGACIHMIKTQPTIDTYYHIVFTNIVLFPIAVLMPPVMFFVVDCTKLSHVTFVFYIIFFAIIIVTRDIIGSPFHYFTPIATTTLLFALKNWVIVGETKTFVLVVLYNAANIFIVAISEFAVSMEGYPWFKRWFVASYIYFVIWGIGLFVYAIAFFDNLHDFSFYIKTK